MWKRPAPRRTTSSTAGIKPGPLRFHGLPSRASPFLSSMAEHRIGNAAISDHPQAVAPIEARYAIDREDSFSLHPNALLRAATVLGQSAITELLPRVRQAGICADTVPAGRPGHSFERRERGAEARRRVIWPARWRCKASGSGSWSVKSIPSEAWVGTTSPHHVPVTQRQSSRSITGRSRVQLPVRLPSLSES